MPRSIVLNFLSRYNREHSLTEKIWGGNASNAVNEAITSYNKNIALNSESGDIVFNHSNLLTHGYETKIIGELDNLPPFPIKAGANTSYPFKISSFSDVVISNWHDFHLVKKNSELLCDASSVYAPLTHFHELADNLYTIGRIDDAFVFFDDTDSQNYCHFTLDYISKLYLFEKFALENNIKLNLILPRLNYLQFHIDFFKKFSTRNINLIFLDEKQALRVNNLYYLGKTICSLRLHPAFKGNLAAIQHISNYTTTNSKDSSKKRILWVQRLFGRKLVNESELIGKMKIIFPDLTVSNLNGLSVDEQANLFARHDIIVGTHGAAFSNIIYCNSQTKLIEIFASNNGTPCFAILAKSLDIQHYSYVGTPILTNHPNHPEISINMDLFLDFFKKFEIG